MVLITLELYDTSESITLKDSNIKLANEIILTLQDDKTSTASEKICGRYLKTKIDELIDSLNNTLLREETLNGR